MTLGLCIVAGLYAMLGLSGVLTNALLPCLPAPGGRAGVPVHAFRHPVSARLCAVEQRVQRLENALGDMCAAVLHADDVGLLEQHAAGMGPVYMDGSFKMSRGPLMLRAAVRDVMLRYEIPTRPVERKWLSGNHSEAVDKRRDFF